MVSQKLRHQSDGDRDVGRLIDEIDKDCGVKTDAEQPHLTKMKILLPLALLPCLGLSLPQRSADWYTSYAGDSVHYASPVDPGGGGGGALDVGAWRHPAPVSRGSQWLAAFSPDPVVIAAHRRQFQEEEPPSATASASALLTSVREGLKGIGQHVVQGFSKLTGVDVVDAEQHFPYDGDDYDDGVETNVVDDEQSFFDKMKHGVMNLLPGKKVPKREVDLYHQPPAPQPPARQPYQASAARGSSSVRQYSSPPSPLQSAAAASSSFHLPQTGLFRIIPVSTDDPAAPTLFQIVPQISRADQPRLGPHHVPRAHSHPYQTDFGRDEPWRREDGHRRRRRRRRR